MKDWNLTNRRHTRCSQSTNAMDLLVTHRGPLLTALVFLIVVARSTWGLGGESVIPLLSGFTADRIAATYPPTDEESLSELAKLIYRLRSVNPAELQERASRKSSVPTEADSATIAIGDAVEVDGVIEGLQILPIPKKLVEFLEFTKLQVLAVREQNGRQTRVITLPLPADVQVGDRVKGVGVAMQLDSDADSNTNHVTAIACIRLRWFPESSSIIGWQLLRNAGVDISLLSNLGSRNRRPLMSEDGDAFYAMMAAAAELKSKTQTPKPTSIEPVTLLQGSADLAGQWINMDLETVLVTRIAVTEPQRQTQLGSDHYYQIDAVGDLGKIVVQIERADGNDGPPATFNNRYPVSLVIRELPVFLEKTIRVQEGGDAIVSEVKMMIQVDGFFFRLWSYDTDFMAQHGGGEQFGPLLIAAEIRNVEPDSNDPTGVNLIGSIAAVSVIFGILGIWTWQRRTETRDRAVRQRKKEKEAESLRIR
ncbi:MAG: hypothetical protein OSA98_07370 [Rubripirellula sp.]|nr:hypothetical protein [Rubripirellula sp.]